MTVLRPKLDNLSARKLLQSKYFSVDKTIVIVSITDRTEHNVNKRSDDLDIYWKILKKQLETWSHLFRAGKDRYIV